MPRDAAVVATRVTTPYDVSRGGFSGAQFNLRSGGGSNYIRRTNSLNFDAPSLQWTDRAARALVFEGLDQPNGYTEPLLHRFRQEAKAAQTGNS